jgi:ribose/xylose/arabinose/galactoside ABC-type transport system permease subunit
MLGLGAGIGLLNGLSITRLNMPAFMVTLATTTFFGGAAIWYTTFHSTTTSIYDLPDAFIAIGDASIAGLLPIAVAITLAAALVVHVVLSRTVLGRWLYAVGQNPRTAYLSGVPVRARSFRLSSCPACSRRWHPSSTPPGSDGHADPWRAHPPRRDRRRGDRGHQPVRGQGKVIWTVFGVLFLVLIDTTLKLSGPRSSSSSSSRAA